MRCFRRKRLHLILALRATHAIDLLVLLKSRLSLIDTCQLGDSFNYTLCNDSCDSHRWLFGGKDHDADKGFIKSIRIVYK